MKQSRFSAERLSAITGLTRRTIRYYVQEELIDKPVGEKNGAYYTDRHLADLLWVKEKAEAGYKLAGIRSILEARKRQQQQEEPSRRPDVQEIWTHLNICSGIKLLIEPSSAQIPPQDLRNFIKGVIHLYQKTILHHQEK